MAKVGNNTLVSIIMPCYNAGSYVKEAIFSILNQTWQNVELLICDDASLDNTREIIDSFNDHRIRKFYHSTNIGYLLTCNELFSQVHGQFVTFQDADDFSEPGRIAMCLDAFNSNQDLGFVTTDFRRVNKAGKQINSPILQVDLNRFKSDSNYKMFLCGATIFIKKDILQEQGGYHPFFARKGGEDYEWLFRIARFHKGIHINETLYVYRLYDSQVKLYNMRHRNIDSFIIRPAVEFIRKVWIERKQYLLDEENVFWLEDKIRQLEEPFHKDNSMFYRHSAIEFLNLFDYKRSIYIAFMAIKKGPFKLINYIFPIYILYLIFRRKFQFQLIPGSFRSKWQATKEY